MLTDHDFHPDEATVRIFRTLPAGVLRLDDSVAISEACYGGVVPAPGDADGRVSAGRDGIDWPLC